MASKRLAHAETVGDVGFRVVKKSPETVARYIAAQPAPARPVLRQVRAAIRKALPSADESISYGMPTYKAAGQPVLYFACWKAHYSLYPLTPLVLEACAEELADYEVKKKTLRFSLSESVPTKLVERIARLRAKEMRQRVESSSAKR